MVNSVIEIEGIGKRYRIGSHTKHSSSIRDEIADRFSPSRRRARDAQSEFWALDDISFDVQEGDAVGIIGRNGAGKSTLLKVLSRITPPTTGKITMCGRVASLLEVGTGFHPELTGRENVYLNGAILGMTRREISGKFDDIVAFAEVEKFLDTPVKRYSSGMYVRLAFAVAAHLEAEILVVDEVLAVGDSAFQQKCLDKMGNVTKGGRTVLFVSHNMAAVSQLCSKGVVLAGGRMEYAGPVDEAIMRYTPRRFEGGATNTDLGSLRDVSDSDVVARFQGAQLSTADGEVRDVYFIGESLKLTMHTRFHKRVDQVRMSFRVRSAAGSGVYHCVLQDSGLATSDLCGDVSFTAVFPKLALYPGSYFIDDLWLATNTETLDTVTGDVLSFSVAESANCLNRTLDKNMAIVHEVPEWTYQTSS